MNENENWLALLAKEVAASIVRELNLLSLREGEDSVLVFRMHLIFIILRIAPLLSGVLLLSGLWILLVVISGILYPGAVIYLLLTATILVGFVALVLQLVNASLEWWSTMYVVTNKRIFIQTGIIKQQINEAMLSKIQDISYERIGFLDTLLERGNVTIETASFNRIVFKAVANAPAVRDRISRELRPIQTQIQRQEIEAELRKRLGL